MLVDARRSAVALVVVSALLVACGGEAASSGPTPETVNITVQEWAVLPNRTSVPAGLVNFTVTNEGPAELHEVLVIRTDLDAADLPRDPAGGIDAEAAAVELVGGVGEFAVGRDQFFTLELSAGHYVLACSLVTGAGAETHDHYLSGMRINFEVEEVPGG